MAENPDDVMADDVIAFLSDVHGNVAALRAVLEDIRQRNIQRVYSLGDLVGYGPQPNEAVDAVREAGIESILGNYDDGIGYDRGTCGCFYPNAEARRIGDFSYDFTASEVTEDRKAWLRERPRELRINWAGRRLLLVHGSPRRINEYLPGYRDDRTYMRLAKQINADILLFGHTHIPWHRGFGRVLFVNAGSVGYPKDGDNRAGYVLLHACAGRLPVVQVVRVSYDVEETVRELAARKLPSELVQAFRNGN